MKNINADHNGNREIFADNSQVGTGLGNFIVSNVNARSNSYDGLVIISNGIVTLSKVVSMLNLDDGIEINSYNHKVVVSNSVMIANSGNGMDILAGTGIVNFNQQPGISATIPIISAILIFIFTDSIK